MGMYNSTESTISKISRSRATYGEEMLFDFLFRLNWHVYSRRD